MKKKLLTLLFVVTFFAICTNSAAAVENDMVKVGLKYGSSALFSANLENAVGEGYEFGYYDEDRDFVSLGETDEITISMTAAGTIYMNSDGIYSPEEPSGNYDVMGKWHIQLEGFEDFDEALEIAWEYDGYPAYIDGEYVVRSGAFEEEAEALEVLEEDEELCEDWEGDVARSTDTGVIVTVTKTTEILFEFDCSGIFDLGVLPTEEDEALVVLEEVVELCEDW